MRMKDNQRIQNYLSSICMQILHKDKIKNKLEHCLNEIIENQISRGIPEEKAIDSAMGNWAIPATGKNLRWLECLFTVD